MYLLFLIAIKYLKRRQNIISLMLTKRKKNKLNIIREKLNLINYKTVYFCILHPHPVLVRKNYQIHNKFLTHYSILWFGGFYVRVCTINHISSLRQNHVQISHPESASRRQLAVRVWYALGFAVCSLLQCYTSASGYIPALAMIWCELIVGTAAIKLSGAGRSLSLRGWGRKHHNILALQPDCMRAEVPHTRDTPINTITHFDTTLWNRFVSEHCIRHPKRHKVTHVLSLLWNFGHLTW